MAKNKVKTRIAEDIEQIKNDMEDGTYMQAILEYCENNSIDIESKNELNSIIDPTLKFKLTQEAMGNNLLAENKNKSSKLAL